MEKKDIKILAIESSCDETSAAVVVNGREVLSNIIYSQIDIHTLYGGVVPEIASRKHIEKVNQVIRTALKEADCTLDDIDAIAVTYGPGLVGALLVGVGAAKAISYAKNIPLVGVHHIEGHIAANFIEDKTLEPPFMCLVVSGGHTHLVKVTDYGQFEKEGNPDAIEFPRAKISDSAYDFSFSGLKSAVLNYINQKEMKNEEINRADVAASFQKAVTDVLTEHTIYAARKYGMDKVALAGGVASNSALRASMKAACEKAGIQLYYPAPILCTDNAAMIGAAGYYEFIKGTRHGLDLNAVPNLKLGER